MKEMIRQENVGQKNKQPILFIFFSYIFLSSCYAYEVSRWTIKKLIS